MKLLRRRKNSQRSCSTGTVKRRYKSVEDQLGEVRAEFEKPISLQTPLIGELVKK